MNEILKERIQNIPYRITRVGNGANDAYNEGVRHGAEWMLSHMWISVKEALPLLYENVLVITKSGKVKICHLIEIGVVHLDGSCSTKYEWEDQEKKAAKYGIHLESTTHWMPIPELKTNYYG